MLGCLVASMTIGAAVLDWVQPNRVEADTPRRQLIAQIQNSIHPSAAEGSTIAVHWRGIRAVPITANDPSRAHFVVDRNGKWDATEMWQDQKPVGEVGMIRIGLHAAPGSGEITTAQWTSTTKLRDNLREMYGIAKEGFILSPNLRFSAAPQ